MVLPKHICRLTPGARGFSRALISLKLHALTSIYNTDGHLIYIENRELELV